MKKSYLTVFILLITSPVLYGQLKADVEDEVIAQISLNDFRYNPNITYLVDDFINDFASESGRSGSFLNHISERPGLAFVSSAILPGLGQAANRQWWKTALFAGIEIGAIAIYYERRAHARSVERDYWEKADNNWSVVQYAEFLANYSQIDFELRDVFFEDGWAAYMANSGRPTFNHLTDQGWINLSELNRLETLTLYRSTGMPFSHVVPAYNSQQYYELVSKYFQFGPGWRDWNDATMNIDGGIADMSPMWREHTRMEEEFNDAYRLSSNMLMVLLANHVFSAFDALFTSKLRLHRDTLNTSAVFTPDGALVNLSVRF